MDRINSVATTPDEVKGSPECSQGERENQGKVAHCVVQTDSGSAQQGPLQNLLPWRRFHIEHSENRGAKD